MDPLVRTGISVKGSLSVFLMAVGSLIGLLLLGIVFVYPPDHMTLLYPAQTNYGISLSE